MSEKKEEEKTKRRGISLIWLIALGLLFFIAIGYATLTTQLTIRGTASAEKVIWDVHFNNINVTSGSVSASTPAKISSTDPTKVDYAVNFKQPGDFYEFTLDIVNSGNIDAKIESIIADKLTIAQDKYLNYSVTYSDGTTIKENDTLNSGVTKKIKIRLEFDDSISGTVLEEMPNSVTVALAYELDYVKQ